MKLQERDIRKQGCDFLKAHGWRNVRTQFAFAPGSFSTGEPGMADDLFLRYEVPCRAWVLWVEWKTPTDRRRCMCRPGENKLCRQCRQKQWARREEQLGATVLYVSNFEELALWYDRTFGFLHRGDTGRGQLEMPL